MQQKNNQYIFDASAILALFHNEPGSDVARQYLPGAVVSCINLAEVIENALARNIYNDKYREKLPELLPDIIPFNEEQAHITAKLRPITKQYGLSLADRACLALAKSMDLPVITADKIWKELDIGVKIIVIR